jgi:hypothetical protein
MEFKTLVNIATELEFVEDLGDVLAIKENIIEIYKDMIALTISNGVIFQNNKLLKSMNYQTNNK